MISAALIGLGRIGLGFEMDPLRVKPASHLGAMLTLHKNIEVRIICDTKPNIFEELDHQVEIPASMKGFPCYRDSTEDAFFEHLKQEPVDLIVIATPPETHFSLLNRISQLESKPKFVFCEKPLSTSYAAAVTICNQYDRLGIPLAVNHTRRWEESWNFVKGYLGGHQMGSLEDMYITYSGSEFGVGIHAADLINWFNPKHHHLIHVDVDYLLFTASFSCTYGAIHIGDNGTHVNLFRPKGSTRYSDIMELESIYGQDYSHARSPMLTAYENILNTIKDGEWIACTGWDGARAIKTLEENRPSARSPQELGTA